MGKTNFADGSWLLPAFMDTFFGTTDITGHAHSGLDADGSAPLVDAIDHIDFSAGTVSVKVTTSYVDVQLTGTWSYFRIGKLVVVLMYNTLLGTQASESGQFRVSPATVWPADMISAGSAQEILHEVWSGGNTISGFLQNPVNSTHDLTAGFTNASGIFDTTNFSGNKGISFGTFLYYKA